MVWADWYATRSSFGIGATRRNALRRHSSVTVSKCFGPWTRVRKTSSSSAFAIASSQRSAVSANSMALSSSSALGVVAGQLLKCLRLGLALHSEMGSGQTWTRPRIRFLTRSKLPIESRWEKLS